MNSRIGNSIDRRGLLLAGVAALSIAPLTAIAAPDGTEGMTNPRYPNLPLSLAKQLRNVEASVCGPLHYFPCKVGLLGGETRDFVYFAEESSWFESWGIWPEDDRGKTLLPLHKVVSIESSPSRLPAAIANELYQAGESGMGYVLFVLVFDDGSHQAYGSGNAVDFIEYPPGKTAANIVKVVPHEGRSSRNRMVPPDYAWCLFSGNVLA